MRAITCPVILNGVSTKVDGSLNLRFSTPELKPDEKLAFLEIQNRSCKLLLQPDDEAAAEMKEVKAEFARKTPSARLRGLIFVQWKYLTDSNQCEVSFEYFYTKEIEKICDKIKSTLPEK